MKPTIRELSKLIGYSPATISNALNHRVGVNEETAKKILDAARYYGYLDADSVSRIRFVIFKDTGILTEDISSINQILDGVQSECKNSGIEIRVQHLDRKDIGFEKSVKEIFSDLSCGIVLVGAEIKPEDMRLFCNTECPLVVLGNWDDSIKGTGIMVDNSAAIQNAIDYLVTKGHTKIGYLRSGYRAVGFRDNEQGYQMGLQKNYLTYRPEWTITIPANQSGAYDKAIREYMRHYELPTAFVADSDYIAFEVMKTLKKNWISVPEQVSIIGFGDTPYTDISSPRLTSFRVPYRDMGIMAVQQIVEIMRKKSVISLKMSFKADLIERDSVRKY